MENSGYISKKVIRCWLDNFTSVLAEDRLLDAIAGNTGYKEPDGMNSVKINKIMLIDALKAMRTEDLLLYRCTYARWINPIPLGETLRAVGLTKDVYYKRCSYAIDFIYCKLNGI